MTITSIQARTSVQACRAFTALAAATLFSLPAIARGEGRVEPAEGDRQVELFAAIDAGDIEVKFIPQDAAKANLIVRNRTDKPLHIALPAAFAGVPVQAQMMGGGMGGMGGGMGGMGGGMGGMGGGMGGMGGGMGQMMGGGMGGGMMGGMGGGMGGGMMGGMGGGMMRVAPEKTQKMALNTVCLEHGKPDPNPRMDYTIVPLDKVVEDRRVHAVCEALGHNLVTQNTAQAAAWHFTDNMSWGELAQKNRVESKYTGNVRFFNPIELRTAAVLASEAHRLAAKHAGDSESGDSDSDSSDEALDYSYSGS